MELSTLVPWLQFHALISVAVSFILGLLYFRLYRHHFLLFWAISWVLTGVHQAAVPGVLPRVVYGMASGRESAIAAIGVIAAYFAVSFIILAGLSMARAHLGRFPQFAAIFVPLVIALMGVLAVSGAAGLPTDERIQRAMSYLIAPREALSAGATILFACMFAMYHPRAQTPAGIVTGVFCILIALHRTGSAFTAAGISVYGPLDAGSLTAADAVLTFGLSLGLIVSVMEDAEAAGRQLASVYEASPDGMLLADRSGRILRVNSAFCRLVLKDSSELRDRFIESCFYTQQDARWAIDYESGQAKTAGTRREVTLWDGRKLWLEVTTSFVDTLEGPTVFSIVRDVSRQVQMEAALEESRQRMTLAFESTDDSVFDWNVETGEVFFAPRLLSKLGEQAPPEPSLEGYLQICHPEDREKLQTALAEALGADNVVFEVEHRMLTSSAEPLWLLARGSVVERTMDGRPVRVAGTLRDISERKRGEADRERLRQELVQMQKVEAIGRLASGVAHDFNNLLTVVLGCSEGALADLENRSLVEEYLREIREAGERGSALTSRLLAFSRKQASQPRQVSLNDIVRDSERMLRRVIGEDVAVTCSCTEGIPKIMADPREIEQVLLNLAVNSRDAMPLGGSLIISTAEMKTRLPKFETNPQLPPGDYVVLRVTDTGHGMPEEVKEQIFEPFFTTKVVGKGTGLGLSTVLWIVKRCGGAVAVASEVDQGTSFTIYFPATETVELTVEPIPIRAACRGSETVLVVEDENNVRKVVTELLRKQGYHVLAAASGEEALRIARESPEPLDVLITDIVMSDCRGPDLAETVSSICPHIVTLFMSGYSDNVLTHPNGAPFIQKPFSPEQITAQIREMLAQSPRRRERKALA